jgi:hypothetical protein
MNRNFTRLLITPLVLLLIFFHSFGQPFEGIIKAEYFVAETNSVTYLEWFITPHRIALEMRAGPKDSVVQSTRFIMQEDEDVMKILSTMPDGKKYFNLMEDNSIHAGEGFNYKSFETVRTDEFSVLLDRNCRKLFSKTNSIKSTCWVAEDLVTNVIDYSRFLKSDYDILAMRNWDMTGFPLKSVTTTLDGELISTMIVKEIIPQKLSKSEFEIPPGTPEWKNQ